MKDMLTILYETLCKNEIIKKECGNRIKYYTYPETADTGRPFITIRPMQPPREANHASDKNLGYQFLYQIDVQSADRKKCKEIQQAVKAVMDEMDFFQQAAGLDEYFEETKRFIDARRYLKTTKLYDTDY